MNSLNLELTRNREKFYRLLSRLYRTEVDQILMEQIKELSLPYECSDTELQQGYLLLQEYLSNCNQDALTDLAVDFAKVFLGAGAAQGSSAFPYESVYTSHKKIIMQEARDQVMKIYAEKGLSKVESVSFPEDHLSLELEFMAYLCQEIQDQHTEEVLSCYREQRDFLLTHLLNWIPAFCTDIEKYAETKFYQGIGKITKVFLSLDQTILEHYLG